MDSQLSEKGIFLPRVSDCVHLDIVSIFSSSQSEQRARHSARLALRSTLTSYFMVCLKPMPQLASSALDFAEDTLDDDNLASPPPLALCSDLIILRAGNSAYEVGGFLCLRRTVKAWNVTRIRSRSRRAGYRSMTRCSSRCIPLR